MTEQHQIHTIDVGDHGFINVERTAHEHDNIRISSNIGSSGIMQRLSPVKALELTGYLADAAGVDVVFIPRTAGDTRDHRLLCDSELADLAALQAARGKAAYVAERGTDDVASA